MKIEIVENLKTRMKQDNKYVRDYLAGKVKFDKSKAEHTILITPEVFAKVFSPKRMRLLIRIRRNKINNIYQLAKELGRPYESVYRDIKYLEGLNLLKIRSKNKTKIPYMNEDIKINAIASV